MKSVIMIQARTTSTRLPGKVLSDLAGRPMLAQQLRRVKRCAAADEIVVLTTTNAADEPIVALAEGEGVRWFRGSEHDVLSRYVCGARECGADVIVRMTADCPLIDPAVTDRVIRDLIGHSDECDYASNVIRRTYPRGLDVEAMFRDTLERLDRLVHSAAGREHVTVFLLRERPNLFLSRSLEDTEDNADLRWTVDVPDDLAMMRIIYEELVLDQQWRPYREVLRYVREHPRLGAMNAHVVQASL